MMTDPITIPSGRLARPAYVAFVALLYATPEVRLLSFGLTPEQALCVGNAVSFAIRPKSRLTLLLMRKRRVGADTWWLEFGVGGPRRFEFRPGQFLEWTVPHPHPDGRGQRRSFTIASSPTERDIGIVMRVPERASSFKQALVAAQEGSRVTAARLSGDFVLPPDLTRPLAFVASGVGVAPFRSMARYIVDHDLRCDIVMLYMTRRADEILFSDTFERAERLGLRTVYLLTDQDSVPPGWSGRIGRVNAEVIVAEVPGFEDRTFFVCGSHRMVRDLGSVLRGLGVRRSRISADWFDGSADS
ncbi:MAG: FAD-dependent oxidoreductase [Chloroflexi bacterium]|nr:FAD-dependent oxidoreductase [Chloroflexota bacterium]